MDETCEVLILSCQGRLGNRTIQPRKIQNSKFKIKNKKKQKNKKTKKNRNKNKKQKRKQWEQINIMNYDITFLKLEQEYGLQNHRKLTEVLLQERLT